MAETLRRPVADQVLLAQTVDQKIKTSPLVTASKGGFRAAFFELPTDALDVSIVEVFSSIFPEKPGFLIRVDLSQRLDSQRITIGVPPKKPSGYSSSLKIETRDGQITAETRKGFEKGKSVELSPQAIASIVSVIEMAQIREKGLEFYQEEFLNKVNGIWTEDQIREGLNSVEIAYRIHKGKRRKSGEPVIEHPRAIVNDMFKFPELASKPALINAGWLHDVPEDTDGIAVPEIPQQPQMDPVTRKPATVPFEVWGDQLVNGYIAYQTDQETARLTLLVTRPKPDGYKIKSKGAAANFYRRRIRKDPLAIVLKGFDRLHNSRTLASMPLEKQRATLLSTVRNYMPLIERARKHYPDVVDYLIFETEKALRPVADRLGMDYDLI